MTAEERRRVEDMPEGGRFFDYPGAQPEPPRVSDLPGHHRALGLPESSPLRVGALLAVPLRHRGEAVGHVYLARDEEGGEFSSEDEEVLVMFAAQAAQAGLETLIETSPVGVAVFDTKTGAPLSFNREVLRIMDGLRLPDRAPEELLEVLTVRRGDGQVVSLAEFPFATLLGNGETLRAEELVLRVPDGRSVTVLANVTPLPREEGEVESVVVTM